jgi:RNA-binding protein Luc7-like 2
LLRDTEMQPEVSKINKIDRNNTVCEICGAMQSNLDTADRQQMHLEGKLHIGYEKIRERLRELKDKR